MVDEQYPRAANELRTLCEGWPVPVVRRAAAAVMSEPDAALIAAWLTDPDATDGAPPLIQDASREIVRQLHAQRQ